LESIGEHRATPPSTLPSQGREAVVSGVARWRISLLPASDHGAV